MEGRATFYGSRFYSHALFRATTLIYVLQVKQVAVSLVLTGPMLPCLPRSCGCDGPVSAHLVACGLVLGSEAI
jgi:hypothetical protein